MTGELPPQIDEAATSEFISLPKKNCNINALQQKGQKQQQQQQQPESEVSNGNDNNNSNNKSSSSNSCSPVLNDCSLDSGIAVVMEQQTTAATAKATATATETAAMAIDAETKRRLQQCKRILQLLNRDQDNYRLLRDRLSKIAERKSKRAQVAAASLSNIDAAAADVDVQQICNVCCAQIDCNDPKRTIKCCTCAQLVCRNINCANWLAGKAPAWECKLCYTTKASYAHTSSWVAEQISYSEAKRARSETQLLPPPCRDNLMNFESVSQISANSAFISAEQKLKIREYVEEIVGNLLGGSLERVKVDKLSKSENYLPGIINGHCNFNNNNNNNNNNNHNKLGAELDAASISQKQLRQLIQAVIAETLSARKARSSNEDLLEDERQEDSDSARKRYFQPKNYQDLLATAILNKVTDKEGNNIRSFAESTPDLSTRNIDENFNVERLSTTSGSSSIEPRSDWSLTDNEQLLLQADQTDGHARLQASMDRESVLSDYIAAHTVPFPDFSASLTDTDEDFGSVTSSMIRDGTWESNWLFKKKPTNLPNSTTSNSGGILVPAPVEHISAQIGDKTADEVSDLSELGSDSEDYSSLDLLRCNELNDRLLNKHLIGGQNTKAVLDELLEHASFKSESPALTEGDADSVLAETKNTYIMKTPLAAEAINANITEITLEPPIEFQLGAVEVKSAEQEELTTGRDPITDQLSSNGSGSTDDSGPTTCITINDDNECDTACSIAERECLKWYNAVEMPNNPYAPAALKQRISGKRERCIDLPNIGAVAVEQSPLQQQTVAITMPAQHPTEMEYKRYSRDYYINDELKNSSSVPSSMLKKDNNNNNNNNNADTDDDIVINELPNVPAEFADEPSTISPNLSLQSTNTNTSDDSDTVRVYDFRKQETAKMRRSAEPVVVAHKMAEPPRKRERTQTLEYIGAGASAGADNGSVATPSPSPAPPRGATPPALRFMQPKRKLIDPSQIRSLDEDDDKPVQIVAAATRPVIEKEVAQVLPSVKALARAFLLTSRSSQSSERHWTPKKRSALDAPRMPTALARQKTLKTHASLAEVADEATIASDLSSLETDPSMNLDAEVAQALPEESTPTATATATATAIGRSSSPVPVRAGFLRNNIAFFENLKFK